MTICFRILFYVALRGFCIISLRLFLLHVFFIRNLAEGLVLKSFLIFGHILVLKVS